MKNNKFLLYISLSMVCFLAIANILHVMYLNDYVIYKENHLNIDLSVKINEFDKKIEELKKSDKTILNDKEKVLIVSNMEKASKRFKKNPMNNLKDGDKLYLKDFTLDNDFLYLHNSLRLIATMKDDDKDVSKFLKTYNINLTNKLYLQSLAQNEIKNSFKYQTPSFILDQIFKEERDLNLQSKVVLLSNNIDEYMVFCDLIIGEDK